MMTNPVYGGTSTYGKTEQLLRYEKGERATFAVVSRESGGWR